MKPLLCFVVLLGTILPLASVHAQSGSGASSAPLSSPRPDWQMAGNSGHTSTLGVSKLQTAVAAPGAAFRLQKPVGHLDAGEVHATFTALLVENPAGEKTGGLRIDFSKPGLTDTVYAETDIFPKLQEILQIYAKRLPGPESVRPGNPNGLFWNQLSDNRTDKLHPFSVAAIYDPVAKLSGLEMGRFPKIDPQSPGTFEFPGVLPVDLATILTTAVAAIDGAQTPPVPTDGRGRGGNAPQPTTFDGFVHRATTRVASSQEVGRIEAGGALAVFTALKLQDGAETRAGLRIDLSRPEARDEVYLGIDEIRTELAGIDEIVAGLPAYLARGSRNAMGSYFGARQFWMPTLQILDISYYQRFEETGVALGAFRGTNGYYKFPGQKPETVRAVLEKGLQAL